MKTILVAALLLITPSAHADDWSTADSYREAAYLTLHVADWLQTRQIAKNPDQWRETNYILGAHPSTNAVDAYMISVAAIQLAIAYALPSGYRDAFQYISIGHKAGYVQRNLELSIRVKF